MTCLACNEEHKPTTRCEQWAAQCNLPYPNRFMINRTLEAHKKIRHDGDLDAVRCKTCEILSAQLERLGGSPDEPVPIKASQAPIKASHPRGNKASHPAIKTLRGRPKVTEAQKKAKKAARDKRHRSKAAGK